MQGTDGGEKVKQAAAPRGRGGPTVLVGPVVVAGERDPAVLRPRSIRRLLASLALSAALLAAAFLSAALLSSCSAGVDSSILADGGARVSVQAEIPAVAAERIRKLANLPAESPLFDPVALSRSLARRPGVAMLSASAPSRSSLKAEFRVTDLAAFAASPEIAATGLLRLRSGTGWSELSLRLERGKGDALAALFPGIDPALLEALSPPLLSADELSRSEYREMLASILGERTMAVIDTSPVRLSLAAPGPVISSSGGRLSGSVLELSIPVLELLVLEKPIELSIRWKS